MGDPVDILKEVGLNIATGGFYSIGKAVKKSIERKSVMPLLTQGLDIGIAAVGVDIAGAVAGDKGRVMYNLAGLTAGIAGGGLGALSPTGFGTAGSVTPLVATPTGAIPITAGALESATAADIAGASLTGTVGSVAPTAAVAQSGAGGLANLAGLPGGVVSGGGVAQAGVGAVGSSVASQGVGSVGASTQQAAGDAAMNELKGSAALLNSTDTKGWFESLSPGAQTALVTGGFTGAQMLMGGAQGIFAGASAEKKLELEKLINSQNQQQIAYRNKNNQYAPLLTFRQPGMANTPIA